MSQRLALDGFEERFIHYMAKKLIGKAGYAASDLDDIEQDLRTDLLCCLRRFAAARSSRHGFSVMRVRACASKLLRNRRRLKRNGGRRCESLNAPVHDADGRTVELHELLDGQRSRSGRSEQELRDLILDVRAVVATLEPKLQRWCKVLEGLGVREAVRVHHVPRSSLQCITRRIRTAFENAGLKECANRG